MASNPSPPIRRILLVDCDAFYVQVARQVDPEGAGRAPLLIVGGSASGRGVVTSASYEARKHGVHSAMPTAHALRLCPQATVVPVPRDACVGKSREIREALVELAPAVQAASIDEFYLDLTGTERLFHREPLEATAHRIRTEVLQRTGISVSIGGATRRLLAKLATSRAKPAGVHVVPPGSEEAFMATLRLGEIPGVGPALLALLEARGVVTVRDALAVQPEWLRRWLGERRGDWLHGRIRGIDTSEVDPDEERKSISTERTFRSDIADDEELERRLLRMVGSVGTTLRKSGMKARTVTVKLRDPSFRTRQHSRTVPGVLESDAGIHAVARSLLAGLRAEDAGSVRLLGVGLSGLQEDAVEQLGLFGGTTEVESERDRTLSRVVDGIRARFGEDSVRPGRLMGERSPRTDEDDG